MELECQRGSDLSLNFLFPITHLLSSHTFEAQQHQPHVLRMQITHALQQHDRSNSPHTFSSISCWQLMAQYLMYTKISWGVVYVYFRLDPISIHGGATTNHIELNDHLDERRYYIYDMYETLFRHRRKMHLQYPTNYCVKALHHCCIAYIANTCTYVVQKYEIKIKSRKGPILPPNMPVTFICEQWWQSHGTFLQKSLMENYNYHYNLPVTHFTHIDSHKLCHG